MAPLFSLRVLLYRNKEILPFDYTGDSLVRTGLVLKQDIRQYETGSPGRAPLPPLLRLFQGASVHIALYRNGIMPSTCLKYTDVSSVHRAPALKPESGETEVFAPDGSKTGTARRRTRMLVPVLLRHSQTPVIKRQSAISCAY